MASHTVRGEDVRLRSPAIERIPDAHGITLKRGCTTLRIDGIGATDVVTAVLDRTAGRGATLGELLAPFESDSWDAIRSLVAELRARRLLLPAEVLQGDTVESQLDVFYWHFGLPDEPSPTPPRDRTVIVAGLNRTSAQLVGLLEKAGFGQIVAVSDPGLDDPLDESGARAAQPASGGRWHPDDVDIVVAATDFGGFGLMRPWNERCLRERRPFLPIVVQDLIVYVGPLVVPGATACFECFLRRRYSNLDDAAAREAVETGERADDHVEALHPAVSSIAADLAAIELTKFFMPWHTLKQVGCLLTMNLLASHFVRQPVLRLPRCPACSTLNTRQPTAVMQGQLPDAGT